MQLNIYITLLSLISIPFVLSYNNARDDGWKDESFKRCYEEYKDLPGVSAETIFSAYQDRVNTEISNGG